MAKKKINKPVDLSTEAGQYKEDLLNLSEMLEQASSVTSAQTKEALYNSITVLAEDIGWRNMRFQFQEIPEHDRKVIVQRSKEYVIKHPAYRRIVELNKSFVLGKGINKPKIKNPILQYVIDKIWNNPENKKTFCGFKAFETQIEQRDIVGEIFYKIYVDTKTGMSTVRVEKDPFTLNNVITDTDDVDKVLCYELKVKQHKYNPNDQTFDDKLKRAYVPDIFNTADIKQYEKYNEIKTEKGSTKMYAYVAVFATAGLNNQYRGLPLYYQILPWLKAHRELCEDGATFIKALSRYAWKKKYKNISGQQMDGIKKLAQTFTPGNPNATLNKTPSATASTLLESQNVDNSPIEVRQNPEVFTRIADLMLQQIASGSDKMKHYFANPENANLATATSMELPMIKDFEKQQNQLLEIINTVLSFCVMQYLKSSSAEILMQMVVDSGVKFDESKMQDYIDEVNKTTYETLSMKLYAQAVVQKNLPQYIQALVSAYNSGGITDVDFVYMIYDLFEFDDVEEKLNNIFEEDYTGVLKAGMDYGSAQTQFDDWQNWDEEEEPDETGKKDVVGSQDTGEQY